MKISNNKSFLISTVAILTIVGIVSSCSKLDETLHGAKSVNPTSSTGVPAPGSLSSVYGQLNSLVSQYGWYAMCEHTTDELLGPTRGTDWDDFGTWRKLHLHTWDGAHNQVYDTWNGLNGALFQSTLLAESSTADAQTQAAAKFLRAYFTYIGCDLWGQVQHRPASAALDVLPSVYTRSEAAAAIIADLEAAIPNLPSYSPSIRNAATKEAAWFLEAKVYLNNAVFKQDPTKPGGPYTFDPADMNKVIALCDQIASNPNLSLNASYWDNFKWDNDSKSNENIFVRKNSDGINIVWATAMGFHYNQAPSGWNGFTTLADFYNSFENADQRKGYALPGYTNKVGSNVGFLVGQIQGPQGGTIGNPLVNLKDRSGNPLVFTQDVSLFFSTETKGIRTCKYPLDPSTINSGGWSSSNDFVFFRLSDARLMKAEAILRGGTASGGETPLTIVNSIRSVRGASTLSSVDLPALLAERGRELYLEAWRRNDMIRYGVFSDPVGERNYTSDSHYCVFPIPNLALSSNPNLKQNYGY